MPTMEFAPQTDPLELSPAINKGAKQDGDSLLQDPGIHIKAAHELTQSPDSPDKSANMHTFQEAVTVWSSKTWTLWLWVVTSLIILLFGYVVAPAPQSGFLAVCAIVGLLLAFLAFTFLAALDYPKSPDNQKSVDLHILQEALTVWSSKSWIIWLCFVTSLLTLCVGFTLAPALLDGLTVACGIWGLFLALRGISFMALEPPLQLKYFRALLLEQHASSFMPTVYSPGIAMWLLFQASKSLYMSNDQLHQSTADSIKVIFLGLNSVLHTVLFAYAARSGAWLRLSIRLQQQALDHPEWAQDMV